MAAAAILQNRNIAISKQWFDRSSRSLAPRCSSILLTLLTVENPNFEIPRWWRPTSWKIEKFAISQQRFWPIATKFGTVTQVDPLDPSNR